MADDGTERNGVYTEHLLGQPRTHGQSKSIRVVLEDTQLALRQTRPDQLPKVYGDSALFRDVALELAVHKLATLRHKPKQGRILWSFDSGQVSTASKSCK